MIDHIVLAVPDLADGVAEFQRLTGVRPVVGGSHVGLGTANHLVGLGGGAYLEIIGPDPDQPDPAQPRPFGIDRLTAARVVTWCIRPPDLDRAVAAAVARGYDPGAPREMSRRASDGTMLTWRLTPFPTDPADALVPFLIDWGTTAHPTTAALPTLPLHSFEAEHPDPARVQTRLAALGVDLSLRSGPAPRLVVTLRGPEGPIVLG
jgi:Glyoxalase-like domain